jgi:hypothetical protein
MMLRSSRSLALRLVTQLEPLTLITLLGAATTAGACSSSTSDDTSLASAGGSSATGGSSTGGTAAKGGSSSGGSADHVGTGGSSASGGSSAAGGSSASGGSSNATSVGGSSNASSVGGSANSSNSGGSGAVPTDACMGVPFDSSAGQGGNGDSSETCAGVSNEAEPVPIDLFIMMDRSVSMGNLIPGTSMTRWEALQAAIQDFAQSTNGDDIRAGIGFFGVTGGNDDQIDCNVANYTKAAVEIGTLAEVGPDLVSAMANMVPGGLTPAGPALTGALEYASGWAMNHPGRATAVVLVSDGFPTQCEPRSITELANLARDAHLNAPYVRTYAIGLGGDVNLDAIALGGGTHEAFKVDEGDIGGSFVSALHNVANTKIACSYALPPPPDGSQTLDLTRVQVTYTTAGDASTEEIPSISSANQCANAPNGGWYYDNPNDPSSIEVCPCTCSRFEAGRVDIRVGCEPAIGPR